MDSYGDYRFYQYKNKSGYIQSHNYTYVRENQNYHLFGSKSDAKGFTIFEHQCSNNQLVIMKDLKGVWIKDDYLLFEIIELEGLEDCFDEYFNLMNVQPLIKERITGYTSWYNHYQDINEEKIMRALDKLDQKQFQVFQIDDGFETAIGDWLDIDTRKFPNGLKSIINKIHEKGLKAGIWLAPYECEKNSLLYKNHQDWLVKDEKGNPIQAGHNWSGSFALDFENEEVKKYIKEVFDFYIDELKIDFFKLDFLYAASIKPTKYKSRGQLSYEAVAYLRECCRDKIILGCGVPLQSCYGVFEYCRIGTDVALEYGEPWYMSLMHRERTFTKNCILNTIYRRHLNKRAFMNDPDVFLLREENIKLSNKQKEAILIINHLFGDVLFISDDIVQYDELQKSLLASALKMNRENIRVVESNNHILIENNEFKMIYDIKKGELNFEKR